ncbi:Gfo/Idh/MocA family oxidoreductase [Algoriphagus halophytocola]|uniref:Gfo/Idh/MocA family oxidoreductase n=1 Tax=Algoriphagus halophytocola TaxID=2991499 RepID=A0ABY6MFZ4_9BACT|nr:MULTISPECIES: Gfo/Idh/MocA family oxidoreductase [unclassified Algoriphagus]UZD21251.1 Gfo/Idh/MocA family oxidoreductase [Algoriphagus sp. TR-M5]WBL42462.1 Gfo/Idh/MocA family oxidoreductase [Algoriphagus sp. TR-M9]
MSNPIKTAIVGFGSVAEKMHAPLITVCPDLDLVASVERRTNRCEELYGTQTFRSLEDLLQADAADLIVITTPNEYHFPMAKQCLEAGKHVVVDKPVTIYAHEAEELHRLAEERGLVLSVFHNRRFDGDFMTLQKLVREGDLGDLVYLESHFDRFRPEVTENWREKEVPGNGITFDLGSHLIDQVVLLFGLPKWIQADIRKQRTGAVADDYFDIILDYGSLKARVTAGALVNVPTPKFLLLGKKGSYQKFGLDVQEAAFKAGEKPEGPSWGVESEEKWGKVFLSDESRPYETLPGDYRILYQNVADVIIKNADLKISIPQTISVLKLIEAAFRSAKEGKRISQEVGAW